MLDAFDRHRCDLLFVVQIANEATVGHTDDGQKKRFATKWSPVTLETPSPSNKVTPAPALVVKGIGRAFRSTMHRLIEHAAPSCFRPHHKGIVDALAAVQIQDGT